METLGGDGPLLAAALVTLLATLALGLLLGHITGGRRGMMTVCASVGWSGDHCEQLKRERLKP